MKSQTNIIEAATTFVKDKFRGDKSGHDWYHINRVRNMAVKIAEAEGADIFIVEMAAILHEMTDRKIVGHGNEQKALAELKTWLQNQEMRQDDIDHILYIVENQSYSKSGVTGKKIKSLEGQVMQDSDRLEAIGAIGIARCMIYTGNKHRILHDPRIKPRLKITAEEYKNGDETAINHFYEKLLKLKDLINTPTAKKIAEKRHEFMVAFLDEFNAEWEGKR